MTKSDLLQNIPEELRAYPQWVCWRYEQRLNGKSTKVLYDPKSGQKASTANASSWVGFDQAVQALQSKQWHGVGFVFTDKDPYAGVDLDVSEGAQPTALQISTLEQLDSYAEYSPSGRGVHVIVKGTVPAGRNNQKVGIEIYSSGRFFTMTGNAMGEPKPIAERNDALNRLWANIGGRHHADPIEIDPYTAPPIDDAALIEYICKSEANRRHYMGDAVDWSAAYFALICATCLVSSDEEQVRRVVMQSPLVLHTLPKGRETRLRKAERLWGTEYPRAAQKGAEERRTRAQAVEHGRQIAKGLKVNGQPIIAFEQSPAATTASRFRVLHVSDLEFREPDYIIGDWVETRSLAVVYGRPSSGKSFVAVDMAACIATGCDFHSKETKQGCAVYVLGEGGAGFKRRIKAWSKNSGVALQRDAPLFAVQSPIEMLNAADVDAACDAIAEATAGHQIMAIVLDTLARNFGDGDENSTKDMNRFVAAVGKMMERFSCTVIVVHHSGHSDPWRGRGSSALKAAADAEFRVEKEREIVTVSHTKAKDGPEAEPMTFSLESVELGKRANGEPYTSAVLVERRAESIPARKLSQSQLRAMKAFADAAIEAGRFSEDGVFHGVLREDWRSAFYKISHQEPEARKKAFQRACKELVEKGELDVSDDVFTYASQFAFAQKEAISVRRRHRDNGTRQGHEGTCPSGETGEYRDGRDTPL